LNGRRGSSEQRQTPLNYAMCVTENYIICSIYNGCSAILDCFIDSHAIRLFLANKTDFSMGVNGLIFIIICKDLHKKKLTSPLLIYDSFTFNLITKLQAVKCWGPWGCWKFQISCISIWFSTFFITKSLHVCRERMLRCVLHHFLAKALSCLSWLNLTFYGSRLHATLLF
jgi:hypothetical protein